MVRKEDVSRELHGSCIKRDERQLSTLIACIEQCMNPFAENTSRVLFNLSTGKAATAATQHFLLGALQTGTRAMNEFIQRCVDDEHAFQKPIKKLKIATFAEEGIKVSKRINGKIKEVKMERDMVGRLLMLSLNHKIDLKLVFGYPLAPVPLVFGHIDGSTTQTPKSTLINALTGTTPAEQPKPIDAYIVDGFFFLHLHATRFPVVYEDVARFILLKLVNVDAKEIHLVFDNISSPSIKDIERDRRGNSDRHTNYSNLGLKQKRPTNFLLALRSDSFKKEFMELLSNGFTDPSLSSILGDKVLFLTVGESCFSFRKDDVGIARSEEINMQCSHEEADTRVRNFKTFFLSSITYLYYNIIFFTDDCSRCCCPFSCYSSYKIG